MAQTFDGPTTIKRSGSEHRRAWEWVKDSRWGGTGGANTALVRRLHPLRARERLGERCGSPPWKEELGGSKNFAGIPPIRPILCLKDNARFIYLNRMPCPFRHLACIHPILRIKINSLNLLIRDLSYWYPHHPVDTIPPPRISLHPFYHKDR